jgi:effector-binding domain-containing protein/uncharacterized protein YndB with AHSA1/START domain
MRALKTILIILASLALLLVILGYTAPDRTEIRRTVQIGAPPEVIYRHISTLRAQHEWGPWKDMDRDQKVEFTGEDGAAGAVQTWSGDTVGSGSMRLVELVQNRKVSSELVFNEPWNAEFQVEMLLAPEADGTAMSWTMSRENNGLARVMAMFTDMDKMIGPDLDRGLENLKAIAEREQQITVNELQSRTHRGFVVQYAELPTTTYVGKRAKVKFADLDAFFSTQFKEVKTALGAAGISVISSPCAVYFDWNEKLQVADLMAAYSVEAGEDVKVKGYETYSIPVSKALHIPYTGPHEKSMEAHLAIDDMLSVHALTHYGNVIEEYVVGPADGADPEKFLTHIYYMVR